MQAKDIMTKEVISVKNNTKIKEISQILTAYGIHGVPVVNENEIVEGIITESDFFIKDIPNLYLPTYISFLNTDALTGNMSPEEKAKIEKLMDATANDIMTRECTTVNENIDTKDLIEVFKNTHLYTIPVINNERKITGVVTLADIIRLIK